MLRTHVNNLFSYKSGGFPKHNQTGRGLANNSKIKEGGRGERERDNLYDRVKRK
jgi:hypothetical protein